jgi:hypothetical protein
VSDIPSIPQNRAGRLLYLVGVTPHQGVRESLTQGEGKQVLQRVKEGR